MKGQMVGPWTGKPDLEKQSKETGDDLDTWKYASFKSMEANHSLGSMDSRICVVVSILKDNTFMNWFSCRISRMGRSPPTFIGTMKYFE